MRALAIKKDPNSAAYGTNKTLFDQVGGGGLSGTFPTPDNTWTWLPLRDGTGQADKGIAVADRDDYVFGGLGTLPPRANRSDPRLTATTIATLAALRALIPPFISSPGTPTGTAPAVITTKFGAPSDSKRLNALLAALYRDGQLDELTGMAISGLQIDLPSDGADGTIEIDAGWGLYHLPVAEPGSPPTPDYSTVGDGFTVRDVAVYEGAVPTLIPCIAGVQINVANTMDSDDSRFCGNVASNVGGDGITRKVQYPDHNGRSRRTYTCQLRFSSPQPTRELDHLFQRPSKIVIEARAGKLATTPVADEMARFTFYASTISDGGAEPVQSTGPQTSQYTFRGSLDTSASPQKDFEVELTGATAVPNP